jgi:hypothetical protein
VKAQIAVTLAGMTADVGETIAVPVDLSNVESTSDFTSFQFKVVSSSANLTFTGIDVAGTLTDDSNWTTQADVTSHLVAGFTGYASNSSGTLLNLMFRLDGAEDGITVELQDFKLSWWTLSLNSNPIIPSTMFNISTDAEDETTLPEEFVLRGNYPNPFNPTTNIQFDLPQAADVEVSVMDILGREMISLPSQTMSAGAGQTVSIDGERLASGIYIYRVIARSANDMHVASGTMTLIK